MTVTPCCASIEDVFHFCSDESETKLPLCMALTNENGRAGQSSRVFNNSHLLLFNANQDSFSIYIYIYSAPRSKGVKSQSNHSIGSSDRDVSI
jgi:hypothetical protein